MNTKKAAEYLGVHPETLRRWEREGKLKPARTTGGHRRYEMSDLIRFKSQKNLEERITIGYCRVSSSGQKEDLERQKQMVSMYCAAKGYQFRIIEDIGSGLNYNKKGLNELINAICSKECKRVVINYKDRLIRFGYELIEQLCRIFDVEIEVINQTEDKTYEEELVEDVLSVVTVFSSRLYGQRSHKAKQAVESAKEAFRTE